MGSKNVGIRPDVDWKKIKKTSLLNFEKELENGDLLKTIFWASTVNDLFTAIGKPHFQKYESSPSAWYTMTWFASDGWIHLYGREKNLSVSLEEMRTDDFIVTKVTISDQHPEGVSETALESPWGTSYCWGSERKNDNGATLELWKEYVGTQDE